MKWSHFLPRVDEEYRGAQVSFWFLVLVAVVGTFRSLVHMLAGDGGAFSIAGVQIAVEGGVNIVAIFGQWGASQLVLVFLQWLIILRYRFLVPVMPATVVMEQVLRLAIGWLKPLQFASPPPGAYGSYILLPLSFVALLLSLRSRGSEA